jgi:hypothetical protein
MRYSDIPPDCTPLKPPLDKVLEYVGSDIPRASLELTCRNDVCDRTAYWPMFTLGKAYGRTPLGQILSRLRCQHCSNPPARALLLECYIPVDGLGRRAGWAVLLVPCVEYVSPNAFHRSNSGVVGRP